MPAAARSLTKATGVALLLSLATGSAAQAQEAAGAAPAAGAAGLPTGSPPNGNINPQSNPAALFPPGRSVTVGAGIGQMDHSSWYFQLSPRLQMDIGKFGFAIQAPLNLLIWSPYQNKPKTDVRNDRASAYGGVLRRADWPSTLNPDTVGHYMALLRMIRWGDKQDPFFIQYGEFYSESIGHSTIVDRYNNALELGNPKPGLGFGVNLPFGGIDLFTNNVATAFARSSLSGQLLAGRLYLRPLGFVPGNELGRKWSVGGTFATDRNAPTGAGSTFIAGDKMWAPMGAAAAGATIWGVDTDYELFSNDIMALTPYIDVNSQYTEAYAGGLHIGIMGRFAFPVLNALRLWARLEYRLTQPGYIPEYFDSLYDVQRSAYSVPGQLIPKAAAARVIAPDGPQGLTHLKSGVHGEATVEILKLLQVGATYGVQPAVPTSSNLVLFATLPALGPVKVSAYYLHSNFDIMKEFAKFDERVSLSGLVMVDVFGPIWITGAVARTWLPETDADNKTKYTAQTTWNFGAQLYFAF
jgi:hypothetical protein